ncbi:hypothetical protein Tco_0773493 [Tanacetum coccineum]|uniref:Reverse transcriptase domain-containing protein n=1 Tax=Tanacetum coccineum TaxID=301880 RepID=A0ABQ4ZLX6_9ASTR
MQTVASKSELVEPLPEPERTMNRRLHRLIKRVPLQRRNERPKQPRIVYPPIFDINYFRHFLDILETYNPMDDEPMWAADRVVVPTPGSTITIPETTNEFNIKDKVLLKLDWAKNQKSKPSFKKTVAFADECSSNSDTDKIMARMDAMAMKMDAQYKEFQSRSKQPNPNYNDDDRPMSREEEAKFMQTFRHNRFYKDYHDRDLNRDNWRSSGRNDYNQDSYQFNYNDKPDLQKQLSEFIKAQHSTNSFVKDTFMDLKNKLETTTKNHQASIQNLEVKFDRLADKQSG